MQSNNNDFVAQALLSLQNIDVDNHSITSEPSSSKKRSRLAASPTCISDSIFLCAQTSDAPEKKKPYTARGSYNCSRCGKSKSNHVCANKTNVLLTSVEVQASEPLTILDYYSQHAISVRPRKDAVPIASSDQIRQIVHSIEPITTSVATSQSCLAKINCRPTNQNHSVAFFLNHSHMLSSKVTPTVSAIIARTRSLS